jgi:transposase
MKKKIIVGVDVSKSTLDVFIRNAGFHYVVSNDPTGFAELLATICNISKCKPDEILFCFENTGKYSKMLSVFLHSQNLTFFMEPALAIKRSLGLTRGKNDKVDAKRIAEYAFEKNHKLAPVALGSSEPLSYPDTPHKNKRTKAHKTT